MAQLNTTELDFEDIKTNLKNFLSHKQNFQITILKVLVWQY